MSYIRFDPDARAEFLGDVEYYEGCQPGLGRRFREAVEAAFEQMSDERYGDALYSFVQALLKVTDVTFLTRERVRSTFMEDFRAFLHERIPEERMQFDWTDPRNDPEEKYQVDCRVNGMEFPLFLFGLHHDNKVRDATISLLQFEQWDMSCQSLGIFENQEEINRKVLARFSDVCDKQFSSLAGNYDRIGNYLEKRLQRGHHAG